MNHRQKAQKLIAKASAEKYESGYPVDPRGIKIPDLDDMPIAEGEGNDMRFGERRDNDKGRYV